MIEPSRLAWQGGFIVKLHEFVVRRLLLLIPVMIGVAIFTFAIAHIIPGDPAAIQCGDRCGMVIDYTEEGDDNGL